MQERPFDHPGSISEPTFKLFEVIGGFAKHDESGEAYTTYTVLLFSELADVSEIEEAVHTRHPYAAGAQWSFASRLDRYDPTGQTVIVKQTFRCNI